MAMTGYGGEDTEFGIRLASELGRKLAFNAMARAHTVEDKTIDEGLAQLRRFGATNLRRIRVRHPNAPAPFWIERADSTDIRSRLFRALLNPVADRIVDVLLPITPWVIQRRLLNYKVIRAVFSGYREGAPR
jgi:hypothetical protein